MAATFGRAALVLAVVVCGFAVWSSLTGTRSGRPGRVRAGGVAIVVAAALVATAFGALAWALLTGDFTLAYVAEATSRSMSWPYRLGALWGGMAGSLLLWCFLLAGGSAVAASALRRAGSELQAGAQAVFATLTGGAVLVLLMAADPFARLAFPALDGGGLTPILEHPAMLYHPPILYLGQTVLAVPFALTVAALARGRLDAAWLAATRRAAVVAWVALTVGMVAGAHWAYQELGWGGFWAWDPVENSSLLPWLATTAFLHAALVVERRDRVRGWTAGLALGAFTLALVGGYLTRSGATGSVHAFGEARPVGGAFLAAVAVAVVGGAGLLVRRRRRLGPGWAPAGPASQEAALLANNALLVVGVVVVAAGSLYPLVSEALGGTDAIVGPRFFASLTAVPGLLLLALAGIGPWLSPSGSRPAGARRLLALSAAGAAVGLGVAVALGLTGAAMLVAAPAAGSTVVLTIARALSGGRSPRALATGLAHLGLALLLFGVAGSTQGREISGPLHPGEAMTLGRYRVVHEGLVERSTDRRRSDRVRLAVFVSGRRVGTLRPGLDTFSGQSSALPETALRSTLREDLLVTVSHIDRGRGVVVLDLFVRPLMAWVWIGGIMLALGGAFALRVTPASVAVAVAAAARPAFALQETAERR
jgi:cytochrome c-type biogenesis protein CcmF